MPWTITDVDRHKQGLTDAQKRQWVRIANSVRRECLAEGGSESVCDARAVRQANGVVGHKNIKGMKEIGLIDYFRTTTVEYEIRKETLQGRSYIVAPVVMMVEGVHNGSHGPILHLAEELGAVPGAWNGIPIVIDHPVDEEGNNISANLPDVMEDEVIGKVFNVHMDGTSLKGEVWLDEHLVIAKNPELLKYIEQHHPIDVSIGVFTDEEEKEGEWNNEHYISIARNHRPDHLALLPDGVGACSWEDGCGIRLNKEGGNMADNKDDPKKIEVKAILNESLEPDFKCLKDLKEVGVRVTSILNNEMGMKALVENIQRKLDMMDTDSRVHFLQEVYDSYFVYEVRSRDGSTAFYKRDYTVEDNEEVDLSTDYTEVRKKVEYVNMSTMKRTTISNNEKQKKMANEKKECPACKEKIDALIANKVTKWDEKDRATLEGFEEDVLDKLIPNEPEKKEEPKVEVDTEKDKKEEKQVTFKELLEDLPEEERESYQYGSQLYAERKAKMIQDILSNTKDVWTEDELKGMNMNSLVKIYKSVGIQVDYSMQGDTSVDLQTDDEEILLPTGVGVEEKPNKKEE